MWEIFNCDWKKIAPEVLFSEGFVFQTGTQFVELNPELHICVCFNNPTEGYCMGRLKRSVPTLFFVRTIKSTKLFNFGSSEFPMQAQLLSVK